MLSVRTLRGWRRLPIENSRGLLLAAVLFIAAILTLAAAVVWQARRAALDVIGADGFILHDTDYPETPRVSLADRSYFRAALNMPAGSIHIGKPLLSRSVDRWFVPVARRFEGVEGEAAGIVAAAVEPLFFERVFGQLQLGQHDSIALFHDDSTLVARAPAQPELYGERLAELRLFTERLPRAPSGVYRVQNATTGRMSIIGYAKLTDFPLIVTVAVNEATALSGWRRQAWVIGLACTTALVLGSLLYVILVKRRLVREVSLQKTVMREKLESIGYMTSSVAHDFKNLLAAVLAGVRLLRTRGLDEQVLIGIEETIDRGNRLTGDLLQFAKEQDLGGSVFDPNARIESLTTLLRQTTGPNTSLSLDLAADVRPVEASPASFDASLVNLVINSSQAISGEGEVRVSTRNTSIDEDHTLPPGNYVVIQVEDTGQGIAPEKIDSVFEPFVTTKGRQGTGLGLFQVRSFAIQSGGDARIRSELGRGTTVEIFLPVAEPTEPSASPKRSGKGSEEPRSRSAPSLEPRSAGTI